VIASNGLRPLEIASHILLGRDDSTPAPVSRGGRPAIGALEDSLRPALAQPPCLVAFSGGRDSSALLVVAARVARREGLPDPVPATLRFAGAPQTDEQDWQALAIRHIGLGDWIRRDVTDELDLVGPVASEVMDRHGLPYPYNLHLLAPLIDQARGGSLVTGLGGDQALNPAGRALDVLARRTRPVPRDALRIMAGVAPRPMRRLALRTRVALSFPWLAPEADSRLCREWLEQEVRRPFRWDATLRDVWRSRFMQLTIRRIQAMGDPMAVNVHHPFSEAGFVSALADEAGATGFASRTAAMSHLFGDALPPELIGRSSKASFDDGLWNRHTRAFVAGLDENRLEHALASLALDTIVDARALAAHWAAPNPLANSFLLLQACWLASR
jgi:asparagine synthetase B (glutamine-hydrolysing)